MTDLVPFLILGIWFLLLGILGVLRDISAKLDKRND